MKTKPRLSDIDGPWSFTVTKDWHFHWWSKVYYDGWHFSIRIGPFWLSKSYFNAEDQS